MENKKGLIGKVLLIIIILLFLVAGFAYYYLQIMEHKVVWKEGLTGWGIATPVRTCQALNDELRARGHDFDFNEMEEQFVRDECLGICQDSNWKEANELKSLCPQDGYPTCYCKRTDLWG